AGRAPARPRAPGRSNGHRCRSWTEGPCCGHSPQADRDAMVRLHTLTYVLPAPLHTVCMTVTIDDLDAKLLHLLDEDPHVGVLGASRALGVARGTVQSRLDKLVARGVIRS